MSPRSLKIALAVSVTLNVFVLGAVAGGLIVGGRILAERQAGRPPVAALAGALDPADQALLRERLRASADDVRGDFRAARQARREAIELAGAETFDRAAVEAALERSHASERAGRRKLEGTLLDVLETLEPSERERLAPALARRGPDGRGPRGGRDRPER